MNLEAARTFIYRNARPLDIARWKYLFEGGSKVDVVTALAAYQNHDGGFAHALEPDCWNVHSSPIQTWVATEIIKEIGLEDRHHPIIQGILHYLASGADFDGHHWFNTVSTNDEYPHAAWWDYQPVQSLPYNPTASLLGFLLKYAEPECEIYQLACNLIQEAYAYFKKHCPTDSMSTATCFLSLYEYMKETKVVDLLPMDEYKALLHKQIQAMITYDIDIWDKEYVCKPSQFIQSKDSEFYLENKDICAFECEFITKTQASDGTWAITWTWDQYPQEWAVSKNWWKSDWIIKNVKYYQAMQEE